MKSGISADLGLEPVVWRSRRLLQNHDNLLHHVQIGLSVASSITVLLALAYWRNGFISEQYRMLALLVGLLMIVIYEWRGVFRRFCGRINGALHLLRSWILVFLIMIMAIFITKIGENYSRGVILGWAVLGYAIQILGYQLSYMVSQRIKIHYGEPIRAAVVGSRWLAEHLVRSITNNAWMPDRIIGIIDDDPQGLESWVEKNTPYLGTFSQIKHVIERQQVNRIYIALPISCSSVIDWICKELSSMTVDVIWVPDIFAMRLLNHSVREINGLPLITLSESPLMSETQALTKTALDKVVASIALLLLSPLMLIISLLILKSSPGPIIFRQKRHGWDGKVIEVWKFRSMYVHQDGVVKQAKRDDSRVTPIGKFIRRTSIDELPQLINVLQGTMSLVGPRPHAIEHNEFYANQIHSYRIRHRIKPGITGWAQVNGLRGETETVEKMLRRVEMDVEYINKWSIWLDIKILIKTPLSLLSHSAY